MICLLHQLILQFFYSTLIILNIYLVCHMFLLKFFDQTLLERYAYLSLLYRVLQTLILILDGKQFSLMLFLHFDDIFFELRVLLLELVLNFSQFANFNLKLVYLSRADELGVQDVIVTILGLE